MRTWYDLKQTDVSATVSIFDGIGEFGVSAKNFLNDLRSISHDSVNVEINSPGGDVFAGIAIYNGLRSSGKKINVKVMGVAASAASLIAMAGDSIEMPENTFMMIHNPWSFAMGDSTEMRATADMLDKISNSLVSTYASRSGKSPEDVAEMLSAETWMTAQEAVDAGFATSVTKSISAKASFDADRLPENVKAVFAKAKAMATQDAPAETVEEVVETAVIEPAGPTHAEVVEKIAADEKVSAYVTQLVLNASLADAASITAKARQYNEIQALCALVGKPDAAKAFIRADTQISDVRSALADARASEDEQTTVDTVRSISNDPSSGTQAKVVTSAGIWNAYQKSQGAKT